MQAIDAPTPSSIYGWYRQSIRVALKQKPEEWTFKSDEGYRQVLEHVSKDQGTAFLNWSQAAQPDLDWDLVVRIATLNDSLGKPIQFDYPGLGTFSPSNWRYLCHALKVWQHIDSLGLPEVDIVELGGGYGGLALFVRGLSELFATNIDEYMIVDLREASILQNQFARAVGVPLIAVDGLYPKFVMEEDTDRQFLVSAYAFSEFDQDTRDWYVERLIRYCEHGLIVWNCPEPIRDHFERELGGPVYQFIDKPLSIEPDEPNLYIDHKLVRW